jgi:hypothetical protein
MHSSEASAPRVFSVQTTHFQARTRHLPPPPLSSILPFFHFLLQSTLRQASGLTPSLYMRFRSQCTHEVHDTSLLPHWLHSRDSFILPTHPSPPSSPTCNFHHFSSSVPSHRLIITQRRCCENEAMLQEPLPHVTTFRSAPEIPTLRRGSELVRRE